MSTQSCMLCYTVSDIYCSFPKNSGHSLRSMLTTLLQYYLSETSLDLVYVIKIFKDIVDHLVAISF